MSLPPKPIHEDGIPPSHGDAATDEQPAKRNRRRKRGREREKEERAKSKREKEALEANTAKQNTPLTLTEMELDLATRERDVARARIAVERQRLSEREPNQQLTPATPPNLGQPLPPPVLEGRQVFHYTVPPQNRALFVERFSSDPTEPPRSSPSHAHQPVPEGRQVLHYTIPPQNRALFIERFSSDFSGGESPASPNPLPHPSLSLPTIPDGHGLQHTLPHKHKTVRGLFSSDMPGSEKDSQAQLIPGDYLDEDEISPHISNGDPLSEQGLDQFGNQDYHNMFQQPESDNKCTDGLPGRSENGLEASAKMGLGERNRPDQRDDASESSALTDVPELSSEDLIGDDGYVNPVVNDSLLDDGSDSFEPDNGANTRRRNDDDESVLEQQESDGSGSYKQEDDESESDQQEDTQLVAASCVTSSRSKKGLAAQPSPSAPINSLATYDQYMRRRNDEYKCKTSISFTCLYAMMANPFTNFQVQLVAFITLEVLSATHNVEQTFMPWCGPDFTQAEAQTEGLIAGFMEFGCFPAFFEAKQTAKGREAHHRNKDSGEESSRKAGPALYTARDFSVWLWGLGQVCGACGHSHEDRLHWHIVLLRGIGLLPDDVLQGLSDGSVDLSHKCGRPGCINPAHFVLESHRKNVVRDPCFARFRNRKNTYKPYVCTQHEPPCLDPDETWDTNAELENKIDFLHNGMKQLKLKIVTDCFMENCDMAATTWPVFIEHLVNDHASGEIPILDQSIHAYKCPVCKKILLSRSSLQTHANCEKTSKDCPTVSMKDSDVDKLKRRGRRVINLVAA